MEKISQQNQSAPIIKTVDCHPASRPIPDCTRSTLRRTVVDSSVDELRFGEAFSALEAAWAKEHIVLPGLFTPDEVAGWLSLDDIGGLMAKPGFLAKNTAVMRSNDMSQNYRASDRQEITDRLRQGLSIQLRQLQFIWPQSNPAITFAARLERLCGHPLESLTLFITPPAEQALPRHEDATEVFTLQLTGTKKWNIDGKHYQLQPGDLAYIPANTSHEVIAADEGLSLSLAFIIKPLTLAYVFHSRLEELLTRLGSHTTLPVLSHGGALAEHGTMQETLIKIVNELGDLEQFSKCAYKQALRQRQAPPMQFDLYTEGSLQDLYERIADVECFLDVKDTTITVTVVGGAILNAPYFTEPELHAVLGQTQPFSAEDIASNLDPSQCQLLLNKLHSMGVVKRYLP